MLFFDFWNRFIGFLKSKSTNSFSKVISRRLLSVFSWLVVPIVTVISVIPRTPIIFVVAIIAIIAIIPVVAVIPVIPVISVVPVVVVLFRLYITLRFTLKAILTRYCGLARLRLWFSFVYFRTVASLFCILSFIRLEIAVAIVSIISRTPVISVVPIVSVVPILVPPVVIPRLPVIREEISVSDNKSWPSFVRNGSNHFLDLLFWEEHIPPFLTFNGLLWLHLIDSLFSSLRKLLIPEDVNPHFVDLDFLKSCVELSFWVSKVLLCCSGSRLILSRFSRWGGRDSY